MRLSIMFLVMTGSLMAGMSSCSSSTEKEKVVAVQSLSEKDIYNIDVVDAFVPTVHDTVREASRKVFLTGIDLFRNKKNPDKAVSEFKKAILMCPDAKSYYELGNALMDITNYKEAIDAYHMAEKLNYNPISKVMYNLACAYSRAQDGESALKYIQLSIENGYSNTKHLLTDADLAYVRELPDFMGVYEEAMSGASSPEAALFDLYAVSFTQTQFPLEFKPADFNTMYLSNSIAYDFEPFVSEMVNPNFSREVGDEFYYVALLKETSDFVALIYAGKQVMYNNPPVYHILATYNHEGKLIDKVEIGGYHYYADPVKSYSITEDLAIVVNEYEIKYAKDVEEFGYEENPIESNELLNTRKFQITAKGKIKQTSGEPMAWFFD
jgi:tetratricopeptide (TPR) repeat protein